MMALYRLDQAHSRFTVHALAGGLLSAFAHSPTFAVRDYSGVINLDPDRVQEMTVDLTVKADSLALQDRVSDSDRREIEGRMRGEALETSAYPQIAFRAGAVSPVAIGRGLYRLQLAGELSLHGVTHPQAVAGELVIFADGLRLRGEGTVRMSDYRIKPVTALAGSIRLKDDVKLSFDIGGLPQA